MKKLLYFIMTLWAFWSYAQNISVIPQPQKIVSKEGFFTINHQTVIVHQKTHHASTEHFVEQLRKVTGYALKYSNQKENAIVFQIIKELKVPKSGYTMDVTSKGVTVRAKDESGIFYATQTLRQMLPVTVDSEALVKGENWQFPNVYIEDAPRYQWRGYMQDVSRTFYGVDVIKKYLDLMALYKMNVFHWHLTDDQGWRIEIKKYPQLTSEKSTVFHHTENQPAKRSGYYTQEQIKDVVAYAKVRHITIVPEIDVPGHSWPVFLSYPELGVNKNTYPNHIFPFVSSWKYWGNQFTPNTLDPTKEEVYAFLQNVFTEIAALFPGEYIHFGGDEVRHVLWEKEPHVVGFMKEKNIPNVTALQSYFVKRVSTIISKLGKKPMGWNDILTDGKSLPKETAIMSWLGEEAVKQAASQGFNAVATPASHVYLDITQADREDGTPSDLAYGNINSVEVIYQYNPAEGLTTEEQRFVMGVQGNMWTALTQELKDMNVHVFPRLIAISELGWTHVENKDFRRFEEHLEREKQRLDLLKIDYYKPGGYITGKWSAKDIQEKYTDLSFDVTKKVYTSGSAVAGFFFTSGKNFLEIDGVQLLENGKVISEDLHHALADKFRGTNKIKPFYFNLTIKNYNPKAEYTVRAKVRGVGGKDSQGNFTFNLSPDIPFSAVEAR